MALEVATDYPVYFAVTEDNTVARWRPLVQLIMAIPHMIVAAALGYAAQAASFIAWIIILVTGKLPSGLADFMIMVQRYNARTNAFAFGLTEVYPPFDFTASAGDPGNYVVRLDVNPELEDRNRLTVLVRIIMAIPAMIFVTVIGIASFFVGLVAWFAVLVTGAYPVGMRNFVIKVQRYAQRLTGYLTLLTDKYPPFALA